MLASLALAALLVAGDVPLHTLQGHPHPDGGGRDSISLYESAPARCVALRPDARRATYTYRAQVAARPELSGTTVEGCYVVERGAVLMIFEDGDLMAVPLQAFARPTGWM